MKPEEAFNELAQAASCGIETKQAAPERAPEPPAKPDGLAGSIDRSYLLLRRWTAVIALALPLLLWIGGALASGRFWPQPSMSDYYHNPGGQLRDIFVGALCAIGFFMFFYKGYTRKEDLALNCAGISAVLVALFPMACRSLAACAAGPALADPLQAMFGPWARVHAVAAVSLFLLVAYVCIFQSEKTLKLLADPHKRLRFRQTYWTLGTLMVALPVAIVLLHVFSGRDWAQTMTVFALEASGIGVFGIYWIVKSREIGEIRKQASVPTES